MDSLKTQAQALQECLAQSQLVSDESLSILGDLEDQLSELTRVTAPIYTRTQALTWAQGNIEKIQARADDVLEHLDVSRKVEKRIRAGPAQNLDRFLGHVQQLNKAINFLQQHQMLRSAASALRHGSELRDVASRQCQEYFREVLQLHSVMPEFQDMATDALSNVERVRQCRADPNEPLTPRGSMLVENLEVMNPVAVSQLHRLAGVALEMNVPGGSFDIVKVYVDGRREALEQALQPSGVNPASRDELAKMSWDALERKIQGWIILAHVLVRLLVAERDLTAAVFQPPYDDVTFSEVVAMEVKGLVEYGHSIASVKRTPEKVFALLDMQEHLTSLQPVLVGVLRGPTCQPMLDHVGELLQRLASTAHNTFAEFEDAVTRNDTKHTVQDGTVHPLTAYVINYVKRLFLYRSTLVTLFKDAQEGSGDPTSPRSPDYRSPEMSPGSPFSPAADETKSGDVLGGRMAGSIINILLALFQNLQEKAESYKEEALQNLFLMNNLNYVVTSMQSYESSQLLPDDWVSRHRALVNSYKTGYLKASWESVYQILRGDLEVPNNKKERKFVKERFKALNQEVKALHSRHTEWAIPDKDLREEVRAAVLAELVPLYRRFQDHYRDTYFSKNLGKYMVYSEVDLRKILEEDFFSRA